MTKRRRELRRTRRVFTPEFKAEAVQLMHARRAAGVSLEQIARELDVGPDLLRTWGHEATRAAGRAEAAAHRPPGGESAAAELRRLRREVEVLRQERDFLKKATAFFAKESR